MLIDRSLGSLGDIVSDRAHYFAKLSVSDYLFVPEYPSIVAYSARLNAFKSLCLSQVSNETILIFTSAIERYRSIKSIRKVFCDSLTRIITNT